MSFYTIIHDVVSGKIERNQHAGDDNAPPYGCTTVVILDSAEHRFELVLFHAPDIRLFSDPSRPRTAEDFVAERIGKEQIMSEIRLLRVVEIDDNGNTKEPVGYVCYHPVAERYLRRGETTIPWSGKPILPNCCAVDYPYNDVLREICVALGWQGGTIHQVLDEIKRLRKQK